MAAHPGSRPLVRLVLTCVGIMLLGGPVRAEDPLAGPHAFDDGIQAIRKKLDAGECEQALVDLATLFQAHERQDYVKARRAELEELAMALACGVKHPRPEAKDLVAGKVSKWDPEKGAIKISWTPKTKNDFETHDGLMWFPPRLIGDFSIEIKGSSYPSKNDKLPRLVFGGDKDPKTDKEQTWWVDCHAPKKEGRSKPKVAVTIVHHDGGDKKTVSNKKGSAPKPDKPYKLLVKVKKTKLSVSLFGRSSGTAKKPADLWGHLGLRAGNWTSITFSGRIDPGWLQGKLAELRRNQLYDFEDEYEEEKYIPEWMSEPLSRRAARARGEALDLIEKLPAKYTDQLQEVYNGVRLDEYDEAFKTIDAMQAAGAPEATCEYLRAEARLKMTQQEQALVHLQRCMELEPTFLEGALLQGSILQQLGRFDEALKTFTKAMQGDAQWPRVYEESATSMLMAGRPEDAKRITQLAARNGVASEAMVALNDALAKVVRGPKWRKRFEVRSANYHVMSNMDMATSKEASRILEQAFEAYRQTFGWVPRDKTRLFKVYLFNTRDGFMGYMGDLEHFMGKPNDQAAGVYTPLLKQLLIWNLPQRSEMFNTVRHEGFHQYLDRLMSSPPVWFNEGLAVYHENGKTIDGKLVFGQMHPGYIRLLQQKGLMPLDKFLYHGPAQFYEKSHHSYGQAWLLIHMLKHTKPEYEALFLRLVKQLQEESSYKVLKRNFPPELLSQLQDDLKRYLEKLAR